MQGGPYYQGVSQITPDYLRSQIAIVANAAAFPYFPSVSRSWLALSLLLDINVTGVR